MIDFVSDASVLVVYKFTYGSPIRIAKVHVDAGHGC
jgi:hypothetical protein